MLYIKICMYVYITYVYAYIYIYWRSKCLVHGWDFPLGEAFPLQRALRQPPSRHTFIMQATGRRVRVERF